MERGKRDKGGGARVERQKKKKRRVDGGWQLRSKRESESKSMAKKH